MTTLAISEETIRLPAFERPDWRVLAVLVAMAALFVAAMIGVAQRSLSPSIDAVRNLPSAPELAHLQAEVQATSATAIRQVAPETAIALNAAIPVSDQANPAASPFRLEGDSASRVRSLDCLTAAIYYEAATEPTDGQRGVAQVVLNRVRHPAYPNTVCGVVFEGARRSTGCQFSFACDGSLRRAPMPAYWERARAVAAAALNGSVYAPVGWATHYHADYVMPYWAPTLVKSATVGRHIFYRWRGGWGRPDAFADRFAGTEPVIAWRGGFGQPTGAAVALASARDAAAAEAAVQAANGGPNGAATSVDSFQRAVLRRYEPLQRDSASAIIAARAGSDSTMTASQRWALTGSDAGQAAQAPLGRPQGNAPPPEQPHELQGVRRRWDPTPPAPHDGNEGSTSSSESTTH